MSLDEKKSACISILIAIVFALTSCPNTPQSPPRSRSGPEGEPGTSLSGSRPAYEICASCHEEQTRFWNYGSHATVECKTCHGVERDHEKVGINPRLGGNDKCMECHALVEGEEGEGLSAGEVFEHHLKWVEKKHVIKVNREKVNNRCIYCHDPHLGH